MGAFPQPIFIKGQASYQPPKLPLDSTSEYSEAWLQDLLFRFPTALPIAELAPDMRELVPVCMELNTGSGYADVLYVTCTGQLVLVETKLWRNPEARRTVVAQILDYAKQLTSWTYDDLAREVARATGKGADFLLQAVREKHPDVDMARFVDGINRNLRNGEMLLLIVGDGIRSGAEALVGFIERFGSLRFSFGLVEVAIYSIEGGVMLQPRVLAKTELIRRTVLIPHSGLAVADEANEPEPPEEGPPPLNESHEWHQLFWQDFLQKLKLDDPKQPLPSKPGKSTNIFFSMPPFGGVCWVSAYIARASRMMGVYLTWMKKYELGKDAYEYLLASREEIEKEIGAPVDWSASNGKYYISLKRDLPGDLDDEKARQSTINYLADATNRLINSVRFRLETFHRLQQSSPGA